MKVINDYVKFKDEDYMKLKFGIHESVCETSEFEINGIIANADDFGEKYDRGEHDDDDDENEYENVFTCVNMQFTMIEPAEKVLKKYNINEDEYNKICDKLDGLSFGDCGWCL